MLRQNENPMGGISSWKALPTTTLLPHARAHPMSIVTATNERPERFGELIIGVAPRGEWWGEEGPAASSHLDREPR